VAKLKLPDRRHLVISHHHGQLSAPAFYSRDTGLESSQLGVSVVCCTNRSYFMDRVFRNYLGQVHPVKELIIILHGHSLPLDPWIATAQGYPDIKIYQLDEHLSLGECYNFAVQQSSYDFVAKFDDDDYYAPRFLQETMHAFGFINAGIIGKACRYVYFEGSSTLALCQSGRENMYVEYVAGATMVIKKEIFSQIRFRPITVGEDSQFQSDCLRRGVKIYSINRHNYVTHRRPDQNTHTYRVADDTYLNACQFVAYTDNYEPWITP